MWLENRCIQDTNLCLRDEAVKVFLNPVSEMEDVDEKLKISCLMQVREIMDVWIERESIRSTLFLLFMEKSRIIKR